MVIRKIQSAPSADHYVFVLREKLLEQSQVNRALEHELPDKRCDFVPLDYQTEGQLSTCLKVRDLLNLEEPLLIESCDNTSVWDEEQYSRLINDPNVHCIVWTFRNHINANRNPQMFGWAQTNENGEISRVSVKVPISQTPKKDPGVVGTFWFRKAKYFFEAADKLVERNIRVNNEFYVDSCIQMVIGQKRKAVIFDVKRYISWGTPNDVKTWEYWYDYLSQNQRLDKKEVNKAE